MNTFRLHILAADRVFFEGDCTSLIVPTVERALPPRRD